MRKVGEVETILADIERKSLSGTAICGEWKREEDP